MRGQNYKMMGPYETDIRVFLTDGEQHGEVTISLSMSEPPTQADIDECLEKARLKAEEAGFRLMNKQEFFHAMVRKRLGSSERVAVPGGKDWDK